MTARFRFTPVMLVACICWGCSSEKPAPENRPARESGEKPSAPTAVGTGAPERPSRVENATGSTKPGVASPVPNSAAVPRSPGAGPSVSAETSPTEAAGGTAWPDDGSPDTAQVVPPVDEQGLEAKPGADNVRLFLYDRAGRRAASNVTLEAMGSPLVGGPWKTNRSGFALIQIDPSAKSAAPPKLRLGGNWLVYGRDSLKIHPAMNADLASIVDLKRTENDTVRLDVIPAVEVTLEISSRADGDALFSGAPVTVRPVKALAKSPVTLNLSDTKTDLPRFRVPGRIGDVYAVRMEESYQGAPQDLFEFRVEDPTKPVLYRLNLVTREGGIVSETR